MLIESCTCRITVAAYVCVCWQPPRWGPQSSSHRGSEPATPPPCSPRTASRTPYTAPPSMCCPAPPSGQPQPRAHGISAQHARLGRGILIQCTWQWYYQVGLFFITDQMSDTCFKAVVDYLLVVYALLLKTIWLLWCPHVVQMSIIKLEKRQY